MRAFARRLCVFVPALVSLTASAAAQAPAGAANLDPKAVADSQAALRDLERHLRANAKDADAWHRLGMIAWVLAERASAPAAPRGLDPTRLGRQADTSLRIAAQLAPDKPYYNIIVGRFLASSKMAVTRASAAGFFEQAVSAARKGTDSAAIAAAAVELGRAHWRKYDALANRRIELAPGGAMGAIHDAMVPTTLTPAADVKLIFDMKAVRTALEQNTQALPPSVTGESDYKKAGDLFREAYGAAPQSPRTFRSLAMHLVDREQWQELDALAQGHVRIAPWDAWAWMSLGLASHRSGRSAAATAAFDSARAYLGNAENSRLDNIARVLAPGDTSRIVRGTPAERTVLQRFFWAFSDPVWSRTGNEARTEFLARIAYAELRWTVDELGVRGADTDRGNIYVRYGPPAVTAVVGPDPSALNAEVSWIWVYPTSKVFEFRGAPGFGTALTPPGDIDIVYRFTREAPVRWDNLADIKVDSMPTQFARFRAGKDSVDLYFTAQAPVDSIQRSSDVGNLNSHVWLLTFAAGVMVHDSAALSPKGSVGWSRRVPAGGYIFRAEASTQGSLRAGRSTSTIDGSLSAQSGMSGQGFGVSDLLLATNAEPRSGGGRRWDALDMTPTAGAISRSGQFSLVWENYEFGERGGSAQYDVTITLARERSAAGQIAANILGALAGVARIDRGADKITASFDRSVPHTAAFVDHIALTLGDTPLGTYLLTLEVTDKVTGQKATRTSRFLIRD
jgi:GWxTD domain-containing protein